MSRRRGTTLVELMTAMALAGMIFMIGLPVILTQKRIGRQMEEREAFVMAGDDIFSEVKEELMFGEWSLPGDGELSGEAHLPGGSDGTGEAHLFGGSGMTGEAYLPGSSGGTEFLYGARAVVEVYENGEDRVILAVKLVREDDVVYERTEEVHLLNPPSGPPSGQPSSPTPSTATESDARPAVEYR